MAVWLFEQTSQYLEHKFSFGVLLLSTSLAVKVSMMSLSIIINFSDTRYCPAKLNEY
jgi:hypothetical protein